MTEWKPIEGETLIDPSGLKIRSIKTRSQLLPYEAENIRKAIVKYLAARPSKKLAPFDYAWMLKLHKEMFGDVWEWAGTPRTRDLSLGISWALIGERLGGLALDVGAFLSNGSQILEQAVTIHHRAVQIHPFENGNGRWSRMLANIWLRRHGKSVIEWPEADVDEQASAIRNDYIAAIKAADNFDYGLLSALHLRYWPDAPPTEIT